MHNLKTFLILDDISVNRILLRQMLISSYSYANIIEAKSGEECIQMYEELYSSFYIIDCIFLDQGLPDMSGVDVINRIRGMGYDGPSIMISASSEKEIKEMRETKLFCEVIQKPLDIGKMKKVISSILECHRQNKRGCSKSPYMGGI